MGNLTEKDLTLKTDEGTITETLSDFFNTLFTTEEEQEQAREINFESEVNIDGAIEAIKGYNAEEDRLSQLYKDKVAELKSRLDGELAKIGRQKEWIEFNLRTAIKANPNGVKESKIQFSKKYLSGTVVLKKAQEKLIKPELEEKVIKERFADYKKETVDLNWAELKKNLKILDGKVYDETTGENLSDVISIETTTEHIVVK